MKKPIAIILVAVLMFTMSTVCGAESLQNHGGSVIGIAWRSDTDSEFFTNICRAIETAGGTWVMLEQVQSADLEYDSDGHLIQGVTALGSLNEAAAKYIRVNTWHDSNAAKAIENISIVLFTGGEDISPSLCFRPETWHGIKEEIDYSAERDVSDYLTMTYCLDHDIPVMGFCRGMQMLSVVSGAEIMQDIPTWFEQHEIEYDFEHRNRKTEPESYRDYAPHDVQVRKDSILYEIIGTEMLIGCPSWHHQALENVDNTRLCITGSTETNGVEMIEAVERTDKDFAIGLQFHPEASIVKHLESAENADSFMEPETAVKFFERLIEEAAGKKPTADQDIEEMWQDMEDGLSDAA